MENSLVYQQAPLHCENIVREMSTISYMWPCLAFDLLWHLIITIYQPVRGENLPDPEANKQVQEVANAKL